jgi:hypothetical protein
MAIMETENGRARAWILVQVDSPHDAAQTLYDSLGLEGGDSYVVVRADVVDYIFNVVIPVDAESPEVLHDVHHQIRRITGARHSVVIPVLESFPSIPHDAEGFITEHEYARGHEKVRCKVGRQRWSPGMNAWG